MHRINTWSVMLASGPDSRVPPFAFTEVCPVLQNQIQQPSRSGESTKTEHPRTTGFLSFICRFSWRDREGRLYTSACVGGLISIKGHSCCATNERTSKPFLSLALKFQSSGRLYLTTVPPRRNFREKGRLWLWLLPKRGYFRQPPSKYKARQRQTDTKPGLTWIN